MAIHFINSFYSIKVLLVALICYPVKMGFLVEIE